MKKRTLINVVLLSIPLWCLIVAVCYGLSIEYTIEGKKAKMKYTTQTNTEKIIREFEQTLEDLQKKSAEIQRNIDLYQTLITESTAEKEEIDKAIKELE